MKVFKVQGGLQNRPKVQRALVKLPLKLFAIDMQLACRNSHAHLRDCSYTLVYCISLLFAIIASHGEFSSNFRKTRSLFGYTDFAIFSFYEKQNKEKKKIGTDR